MKDSDSVLDLRGITGKLRSHNLTKSVQLLGHGI